MTILDKNTSLGLLVLRLSLGILMLLHGVSKLFHGIGFIEQIVVGADLPSFVAYGVYIGEIIVPILLILGYATRFSALIFAINCLFAVFLAHGAELFTLSQHGGWAVELLGLYFFGALTLVFTGGGKYAVSHKHWWD
ncbi:DoxX family protein [Massilibacteroides sp.]|uniref:DoxX family protein n=1 Tax=Massilibacteroides sp. TaxID=2034766 RepID=UPI002639BA2B|nr:DoxX family protein [Massilibacteroides sp.]MDD4514243.1 DoxX family protein [Massilibacteroides sp.]